MYTVFSLVGSWAGLLTFILSVPWLVNTCLLGEPSSYLLLAPQLLLHHFEVLYTLQYLVQFNSIPVCNLTSDVLKGTIITHEVLVHVYIYIAEYYLCNKVLLLLNLSLFTFESTHLQISLPFYQCPDLNHTNTPTLDPCPLHLGALWSFYWSECLKMEIPPRTGDRSRAKAI